MKKNSGARFAALRKLSIAPLVNSFPFDFRQGNGETGDGEFGCWESFFPGSIKFPDDGLELILLAALASLLDRTNYNAESACVILMGIVEEELAAAVLSVPGGVTFNQVLEEVKTALDESTPIDGNGFPAPVLIVDLRNRTKPGGLVDLCRSSGAAMTIEFDGIDGSGPLLIRVAFSKELYRGETVERLIKYYFRILEAVTSPGAGDQPLWRLDFLDDKEKTRLLRNFNDTEADYPGDKTIWELFTAQVRRTPDRAALAVDGETLSYKELSDRANAVADYLFNTKRIKPQEPVGILKEKSQDFIIGIFGILGAGGAYVPVDPSLPQRRIKLMIDDTAMGVVLSQKRYVTLLNRLLWECPGLHTYLCMDSMDIYGEEETGRNEFMNTDLWVHVGETAVDDITGGGWLSSYTGLPLSRKEMDEYAGNVFSKLEPLLHKGMRVLEIGVASGITMFRLAPRVGLYYGTDLSPAIIKKNLERVEHEGTGNIKLATLAAHEITDIEEKDFDLIIINSVIQCFHGYNYLRRILEQAASLLKETGWFFLGDIMDGDLKETLAKDLVSVKDQARARGEETAVKTDISSELFVSRNFWRDWRIDTPWVRDIRFSEKIHTVENELTRYRYDLMVEIDKSGKNPTKSRIEPQKKKWQDDLRALEGLGEESSRSLGHRAGPDWAAYIIYTSGSTGLPKGVVVPHRGIASLTSVFKHRLEVGEDDRVLQFAAFSFDASVWEVSMALLGGGTLCMVNSDHAAEPANFADYLNRQSITVATLPPSFLNLLEPYSLDSLRLLITAGSEAGRGLVETWRKRLQYVNAYGPTESTICTTFWKAPRDGAPPGIIPIGPPIDNLNVHILDAYLNLQPVGIPGELCISGLPLARGYLNRPELTAERFVYYTQSFTPLKSNGGCVPTGNRLYKTGDLARWLEDGNIEFLGRIDFQVKVRGFRIEPGEIENRLLAYEDIREAAVIARDDRSGETHLCAYVVSRTGKEIDIGELRTFLSLGLPHYMTPSYIMQLESMPLTSSGKADRKKLPDPRLRTRDSDHFAPGTETEKKLVSIWSKVLNLDPQIISMGADFFQLGGHSLKAAMMATEIHKVFSVKVSVGIVFDFPTARAMAGYIDGAVKASYSRILPAEARDYYPQSSAQKRLYILHRMDKESTGYNVQVMEIRYGLPNKERLEQVFKELIRRHESLRTSFDMVDGVAVQRVHDRVDFKIEYYESSEGRTGLEDRRSPVRRMWDRGKVQDSQIHDSLAFSHFETEIHKQLQKIDVPVYEIVRLFVRPFDLNRAPLLRVGLITVRESRYVLMIDMHHIISDGMSIGIFLREFRALMSGEALPPPRLQYKDFTLWAAGEAGKDYIKRQLEFWLKKFTGGVPILNVPEDYIEPGKKAETNTLYFQLPKEISRELTGLARSHDATMFMVFLSAFNVLLSKLSGQYDIVVGTVSAGRSHADLKQMVGVFVNTLALRNFPIPEKSFPEFLRDVKERSLAAYENKDYAFEDLVAKTVSRRETGRHPLFDVAYVHQNQAEKGGYLQEVMVPGKTKPYRFELNKAKFVFTLMSVDTPDGFRFSLEFDRGRFRKETAERFTGYFETILKTVAMTPAVRLADIVMLPEEEQRLLMQEFNRTDLDYPSHKTLHGLFEEQSLKMPDRVALVGPDAAPILVDDELTRETQIKKGEQGVFVTYKDLDERAANMAYRLREMGVIPGQIVPLVVKRSVEMIVGIFGILKAGAAYLPIDPSYPGERIHYILSDSRAKVMVTPAMLHMEKRGDLSVMMVDSHEPAGAPPVSRSQLAYVIYTSGTTGWPKGVLVEHSSAVNTLICRKELYQFNDDLVAMQLFSYAFDGFITSFFTPVISGGRVVLLSEEDLKDIIRIKEIIVKQGVNHFISVPALYGAIIEAMKSEEAAGLKIVTLAGDKIQPTLLEATRHKNPNLEIAHEYGVTEASVMSAIYRHQEKDRVIKIGGPVWNTRLYILDKWNKPQPLGIPGELVIGGAGIARGYLNRPELTAERFTSSTPLQSNLMQSNGRYSGEAGCVPTGNRLYKTGDMARWLQDGTIEFLGRIDHQVKVKGFRIEAGEIENQILSHQGVKEVVVMAREDSTNEKYLCAYYVNQAGGGVVCQPELWPSVAEFFIYDELLYYAMTNDERRNNSYKAAFNKLLKDKIVVEVGTGQDAILSRFAVEAGAKQVYAIEMLDESYKKAKSTIERLGLTKKIKLVYGDANKVKLPEKGDVLISEIVGSIGGSEGAAVILNKAWRFLNEGGKMIPIRSVTKIAAMTLPENLKEDPGFAPVAARYTEKVFRSFGYSFDLRLCIRNFPKSNVISNADVFEDLDFSGMVPEEETHNICFEINRDGMMDGFILWLTLETIEGELIDTLEHEYCWLPVYVPVFYPGVDVLAGDKIEAVCERTLCENGINPDFKIHGVLKRRNGPDLPFAYELPHFEKRYRERQFYKKLFRGNRINEAVSPMGPDANELRGFISHRLPPHMLPSYFIRLDKMPLTPNDKIDRSAFKDPKAGEFAEREDYVPPQTEYQALMADIWQQVLGVERVGIEDDFFVLGGDSIKSLQVVARLHRNGLKLDANRLFLYKTIKAVTPFLRTIDDEKRNQRTIERGPVEGEVELTAIQQWFFGLHAETGKSFAQSALIFRESGFDGAAVRKVFTHLLSHHDALRMVFTVKKGKVKQWNRGMMGELFQMEIIPLSGSPAVAAADPEERNRFIHKEMRRMRRTLDWREEPLVKLMLFKGKEGDYLGIIIHHLVIDGVSWRILLEDFETAYHQVSERKGIVLPEKTTSFKQWSGKLREYAHSSLLLRHLEYWRGIDREKLQPLPADRAPDDKKRVFGDSRRVELELSQDLTSALRTKTHNAYNTGIDDLLLSALALALGKWAKRSVIAIHMEGHGREPVIKDLDISRTVGWFTSQYPVILETGYDKDIDKAIDKDIGQAIKATKETLRRIPNKGIDYGILKYLTKPKKKNNSILDLKPDISFNYLGDFDHATDGPVRFIEDIDAEFENPYKLNIEGITLNDRMSFTLYYNRMEYDRGSIEQLADNFQSVLEEITAHCLARTSRELTPSDLGFAGISLECLEEVKKRVLEPGRTITAIYPLTPMQRTMFRETRENKEAYFIGNLMTIPVWTRHDLLEKSFSIMMERYEPFRTRSIFGCTGLTEPVQLVLEHRPGDAHIAFEDISDRDKEDREQYLESRLAADKSSGFDLIRQTPIRLTRFKTGEASDFLIWNLHHIILDGWCLGILLRELTAIYNSLDLGRTPKLPAFPRHRDFVSWQRERDTGEALNYWKRYLKRFSSTAMLSALGKGGEEMESSDGYRLAEHYFQLDEELSGALRRLAGSRRVTLNTLYQTLWAGLVSKHTGKRDLLFGAVVSGRSADFPGIEGMVGLFIEVAPVRVKMSKEKNFGQILESVQRQSLKSKVYEGLPLDLEEILGYSGLDRGVIDNVLIFENYPNANQGDNGKDRENEVENKYPLTLGLKKNSEQFHYSFVVYVVPGATTTIRFSYNALVYHPGQVKTFASDFQLLARRTVES